MTYSNSKEFHGTKQWGVKEVRETTINMVNSLSDHYSREIKNGYIKWDKISNNTSEHIDTNLISNEISTELVKRKIPFIDTRLRDEASKEIGFSQTGMVSSQTRLTMGKFDSPSHQLKGELNDVVNFQDGKKIQYIVVTLTLIRLETTRVEWIEQSKFLKISSVEAFGL